ncbi:hypothetical protein F0726_00769 [Acidithiobacillus caldus]|nr:hypothetical protein F0726_00769 [Acidithiobacillus caldus]
MRSSTTGSSHISIVDLLVVDDNIGEPGRARDPVSLH